MCTVSKSHTPTFLGKESNLIRILRRVSKGVELFSLDGGTTWRQMGSFDAEVERLRRREIAFRNFHADLLAKWLHDADHDGGDELDVRRGEPINFTEVVGRFGPRPERAEEDWRLYQQEQSSKGYDRMATLENTELQYLGRGVYRRVEIHMTTDKTTKTNEQNTVGDLAQPIVDSLRTTCTPLLIEHLGQESTWSEDFRNEYQAKLTEFGEFVATYKQEKAAA